MDFLVGLQLESWLVRVGRESLKNTATRFLKFTELS